MAVPHLPRGGLLRTPILHLPPLRPRGGLYFLSVKKYQKPRPFVFSGCGVVHSLNRQTTMPIPGARHSDECLVLDPPPNPRLGVGFVAFGSEL